MFHAPKKTGLVVANTQQVLSLGHGRVVLSLGCVHVLLSLGHMRVVLSLGHVRVVLSVANSTSLHMRSRSTPKEAEEDLSVSSPVLEVILYETAVSATVGESGIEGTDTALVVRTER